MTEVEIKGLLERRATFTRGCRALAAELQAAHDSAARLLPLVSRVSVLLRTRFTNPELWKAGVQVFRAAAAVTDDPRVPGWLAQAEQQVHDMDGEEEPSPPHHPQQPAPHPLDVLMGLAGPAAEPRGPAHFDDAGLIIRDGPSMAHIAPPPSTASAPEQGPIGPEQAAEAETGGGGASTAPETEPGVSLLQRILQSLHAVEGGMAAMSRSTNQLEEELEQFFQQLLAAQPAGQPNIPPPMSRKILDSLPVVKATQEQLQVIGQDTVCAVCTDTVTAGDEVLQLPCRGRHWFHPSCVKPWLGKTNTCPVCREELPTDDPHYEAKKEREAEEAAEAAGARNALSHNEFMFI